MEKVNRRTVFGLAAGAVAGGLATSAGACKHTVPPPAKELLDLPDFQPRSMLHVSETKVPKARFPVIDIHTHLSFSKKSKDGAAYGEELTWLGEPSELLAVMDRKNLRMLVNVTGDQLGTMWSSENNIGWWAEREVQFCVPVKWFKTNDQGREELVSMAMVAPFVYSSNGRAVITDREVNGRPALVTSGKDGIERWFDARLAGIA